jgi:hypothetical protein
MAGSDKKKIEDELDLFFPETSDINRIKRNYRQLRQIALLNLKEVITSKDQSAEIKRIEDILEKTLSVRSFSGRKGVELEYLKGIELVNMLLKETNKYTEEMTTFSFYTAIKLEKDRAEQAKKNKKNG